MENRQKKLTKGVQKETEQKTKGRQTETENYEWTYRQQKKKRGERNIKRKQKDHTINRHTDSKRKK
jgi:hypothetical protein